MLCKERGRDRIWRASSAGSPAPPPRRLELELLRPEEAADLGRRRPRGARVNGAVRLRDSLATSAKRRQAAASPEARRRSPDPRLRRDAYHELQTELPPYRRRQPIPTTSARPCRR
jgi:hypothetical protein